MLIKYLQKEIDYLKMIIDDYIDKEEKDERLSALNSAIVDVCSDIKLEITWLIEKIKDEGVKALPRINDTLKYVDGEIEAYELKVGEKPSRSDDMYNSACIVWYTSLKNHLIKRISRVIYGDEDAK